MSEASPKSLPPIRELFSESWNIFTKNIYHFFVLTIISLVGYIVVGVVLIFFIFLAGLGSAFTTGVQGFSNFSGSFFVFFLVALLGIFVVTVAMQVAYILIAADEKKDQSYWQLFTTGLGYVPSLFLVFILGFILIWGSLFVFIFPAIFISILLTFVTYAVIFSDDRGTDAMRQSVTIVSQHFFPIFGRLLFLFGISLFVGIITSSLQSLTKGSPLVFLVIIASMLSNMLLSWYGIAYHVTLYKQAKAATDPKKTSGLLWMWIVAIIGWVIGIAILSVVGVAGYTAFKSGAAEEMFKKAQNVDRLQQDYSKSMMKNKSGSQNAEALEADVFALVNSARKKAGLPVIQQNNQLCAYAQRRLEQLTTYGKWDDAKGFYEDTANPQIVRAYFPGFTNINEEGWDAVSVSTTAEEVAASWINRKKGTGIVPNAEYVQGCIRGGGEFLVFIAGSYK